MNNILYVLIGLPASGKSTWAASKKGNNDNIVTVSSDAIRKELYGSEEVQSNPDKVFNLMHKRACEAFEAGKDVIYDATNLSSRRRVHLISSFQKYNIKSKAIVFNCPYEVCLDVNNRRQRVVPEYAMKRMYHSFEPPHYAEGFHSIEMVYFFPMHVQELLDENIKCPHEADVSAH